MWTPPGSYLFETRINGAWLAVAAFTILYFADVCLRASAKYFWYDELLSLTLLGFPIPDPPSGVADRYRF